MSDIPKRLPNPQEKQLIKAIGAGVEPDVAWEQAGYSVNTKHRKLPQKLELFEKQIEKARLHYLQKHLDLVPALTEIDTRLINRMLKKTEDPDKFEDLTRGEVEILKALHQRVGNITKIGEDQKPEQTINIAVLIQNQIQQETGDWDDDVVDVKEG